MPARRVTRVTLLLLFVSTLLRSQGFDASCTLPFDDIAKKRPVDSKCGAEGIGSPESRAQNAAKNNFCAPGDPQLVTFYSLTRLQAIVEQDDVLGPKYKPPLERSVLKDLHDTTEGDTIGEGDVVVFVAFIEDAHYSNVGNGETVNCNLKTWQNNDIHVSLVQKFGETDRCRSATAEITPHYRPGIWSEKVLNSIGHHPVRITGQLFFDASHKPCHGGKRPNPKRMSSWEIHPVYSVDVCKNKSLSGCKAFNESNWRTLEDWLNPADEVVAEDEEP